MLLRNKRKSEAGNATTTRTDLGAQGYRTFKLIIAALMQTGWLAVSYGANGGGRTHMAVNCWNLNAFKGLAEIGDRW